MLICEKFIQEPRADQLNLVPFARLTRVKAHPLVAPDAAVSRFLALESSFHFDAVTAIFSFLHLSGLYFAATMVARMSFRDNL